MLGREDWRRIEPRLSALVLLVRFVGVAVEIEDKGAIGNEIESF